MCMCTFPSPGLNLELEDLAKLKSKCLSFPACALNPHSPNLIAPSRHSDSASPGGGHRCCGAAWRQQRCHQAWEVRAGVGRCAGNVLGHNVGSLPILEALEWLPASRLVLEKVGTTRCSGPALCLQLPFRMKRHPLLGGRAGVTPCMLPAVPAQDAALSPACSAVLRPSKGRLLPTWPSRLLGSHISQVSSAVSTTHLLPTLFPELLPGCPAQSLHSTEASI